MSWGVFPCTPSSIRMLFPATVQRVHGLPIKRSRLQVLLKLRSPLQTCLTQQCGHMRHVS
jgi:hypothetical protein